MQDDINSKGFQVVREYISNYEKLSLGMVVILSQHIIYISIATKHSGLMNELDRIMEMYTLQKAKNVEFLNSIENVRLLKLLDHL